MEEAVQMTQQDDGTNSGTNDMGSNITRSITHNSMQPDDALVEVVLKSQFFLREQIKKCMEVSANDLEGMECANQYLREELARAGHEREMLTKHVHTLTAHIKEWKASPELEQTWQEQAELIHSSRAEMVSALTKGAEDTRTLRTQIQQQREEGAAMRSEMVGILADRVTLSDQVHRAREEAGELHAQLAHAAADREALRCELARLHSDRTSLRDQMEQAVAETRKLQEQVLQGINARRALKELVESGIQEMRDLHAEVQRSTAQQRAPSREQARCHSTHPQGHASSLSPPTPNLKTQTSTLSASPSPPYSAEKSPLVLQSVSASRPTSASPPSAGARSSPAGSLVSATKQIALKIAQHQIDERLHQLHRDPDAGHGGSTRSSTSPFSPALSLDGSTTNQAATPESIWSAPSQTPPAPASGLHADPPSYIRMPQATIPSKSPSVGPPFSPDKPCRHPAQELDVSPASPFTFPASTGEPARRGEGPKSTANAEFYKVSESAEVQKTAAAQSARSSNRPLSTLEQQTHTSVVAFLMDTHDFYHGLPVGACKMFQMFIQGGWFEAEHTGIFDFVIQTMCHFIEAREKDNQVLCYWLAYSATLLYFLQNVLQSEGKGGSPIKPASGSTGKIPAKYPAMLFKHRLTACLENVYGMIRDNTLRDMKEHVLHCVKMPARKSARANTSAGAAAGSHWGSIIQSLEFLLNAIRNNRVPSILAQYLFTQVCASISCNMFNCLLIHRQCCSMSNGEYIEKGLKMLSDWLQNAGPEVPAPACDQLCGIRQAVEFLVAGNKTALSISDLTEGLCPTIGMNHLHHIVTSFVDDKYNSPNVSKQVLSMLTRLKEEDANGSNSLQLINEDASIPFATPEIIPILIAHADVPAILGHVAPPPPRISPVKGARSP